MTTWVRLGVVGRPHGVRGAVKLHLDNPDGRTLRSGLAVRVTFGAVSTSRVLRRAAAGVVEFADVADRDAAAALTHAVVEVRREDFVDDEDDGVFLIDLIGRAVVDVGGQSLGRISSFHDNGAQPLAEVTTASGERVLVPFVPPIVVDAGDPVVLAPPLGLFDDAQAIVAGDASADASGDDGAHGRAKDGADVPE
jgi:16S rRNA processing protein RimM